MESRRGEAPIGLSTLQRTKNEQNKIIQGQQAEEKSH
jgi:hypothetical protein